LELPLQIAVVPEILPGVAGAVFTFTASVEAAEVPQALLALTVIFPPVEPAVTFMLLVVEVPVHPLGKVQVYVLAPATGVTL
jgi:hypothetical protein